MRHRVLVTIDGAFVPIVSEEWIESVARRVLEAEGAAAAELGVLVTDDETVRELNRRYADKDETTDVLSFSLQEGEEFVSPDAVLRLGEVVISYPAAKRQAREALRVVEDEVAHLLVHGVLHLLGYDHVEPDEARDMRAREDEVLDSRRHAAL